MKNLFNQLNRKLIASVVLLFASVGLMAQANFSGTWALNESKSNFGNSQFRMAANTLTITQDATQITSERTMQGPDGEMKMSEKYKLDGSVSENKGFMDNVSKSTLTWSADKTSVTITTAMSFGDQEFKTNQTWTLGDGGKLLTISSTMPSQDGEMKTTAVYDKK